MNKPFANQLYHIFHDEGLLLFCIVVPMLYPLLYSFIYTGEVVHEVPIAVVDESHTSMSRDFARRMDAAADIHVVAYCSDVKEAQNMVRERDIYGYIQIPKEFSDDIHEGRQTRVGAFADMSGMLYYKALLTTATNVSLDLNAKIKIQRAGNTTDRQDEITTHPIRYQEVSLYNPQGGFASFLIPAVLILIIQQTLLLGIGMSAGTQRDHKVKRHYSAFNTSVGRAMAFLVIYIPVSVFVLGIVPKLFGLIQIGNPWDITMLTLPYLLACIFFAQSVSHIVRTRETVILMVVFTSMPLMFIAGVSWPGTAVPKFWHYFAMMFPSTFGANAFIKVNSCGASLADVSYEYIGLWIQAIVYFIISFCVTVFLPREENILLPILGKDEPYDDETVFDYDDDEETASPSNTTAQSGVTP